MFLAYVWVKVIQKYILALNLVKEKTINIQETYWKQRNLYQQEIISKKNPHILEEGASGGQVGDIKKWFFLICENYDRIKFNLYFSTRKKLMMPSSL